MVPQILSPLSPSPFLSSPLSFTVSPRPCFPAVRYRLSDPLELVADPTSPSPALTQLVYLWSRLNPLVRLSLFGIITITAPYLPYALCLFSWALSSGGGAAVGLGGGWGLGVIVSDLLGIAAGHWW